MEKPNALNMRRRNSGCGGWENPLEIGAYFEVLKYIIMTASFVALALIFIYIIYGGKSEKES